MIYSSFIISTLIGLTLSAPADTCDDQLPCLEVTRDSLEDGKRYRVCLKLNNDLSGCNKADTISHSCYSRLENEKIDSWGRDNDPQNPMCKVVECGQDAEFGLKDGKGCYKTSELLGETISGIDGISCSYNKYQGYCGGGNKGDCTWTIPTPDCQSQPEPEPEPEPTCDDENEIYRECGSPCDKTCDDPNPICIERCEARCECRQGYLYQDGQCILPEDCPSEPGGGPVPGPEPEPVDDGCNGLLPYGATYLGCYTDDVCNYDPYSYDPDPCMNIGGIFGKNSECCYCEPAGYAQAVNINPIKGINTNINNNNNGEEFTQLQLIMINALVSVISCLLIIGLCFGLYCLYNKGCSNTTKKYQYVDSEEKAIKV